LARIATDSGAHPGVRTLVAGTRADLGEALMSPWPWFTSLCRRPATHVRSEPHFCADALAAANAWDRALERNEPFDLVFSVLKPGSPGNGALPDTTRRETGLASGLGLFAKIAASGVGARLVAVADRPEAWGASGVFTALARVLFDADVLDRSRRDTWGRPLVIPRWLPTRRPPLVASPFDDDVDHAIRAAAASFDARAQALVAALSEIDSLKQRGNLSKPIGHAPQWLRTLVKVEYQPQRLLQVAQAAKKPGGRAPKALALANLGEPGLVNLAQSRNSLVRYVAQTFDVMGALASDWLGPYDAWETLGERPPSQFWEVPATKAARAFIDSMFGCLVFEDLDPAWPPGPPRPRT
jgi:hypothetical protein